MPHARKRFGQHFLAPEWVVKVLHAINPQPGDIFIEIGPGGGALTRPLAEASHHLAAFEIDRDLAMSLRADPPPRFTLVEGDFLDVTPGVVMSAVGNLEGAAAPKSVRVAGNLPYNVASPILFKLVDLRAAGVPITEATVMLQREVAERLVATPGTKDYGVLSILIQHQASVARVLSLPPGAFRPAPRVHSAVVRLRFHAPEPRPLSHTVFTGLTRAIFTRRRKTLANALLAFDASSHLTPVEALAQAGIHGGRRPETLSIAELVTLSDAFARAVL
jgi:16S rRNA (adenine1518-N6/adenine1519-N6)-dimethyltransferase